MEAYRDVCRKFVPRIIDFMETFGASAQKLAASSSLSDDKSSPDSKSQLSQNSLADSTTTSGISSLRPSTRRRHSGRQKSTPWTAKNCSFSMSKIVQASSFYEGWSWFWWRCSVGIRAFLCTHEGLFAQWVESPRHPKSPKLDFLKNFLDFRF